MDTEATICSRRPNALPSEKCIKMNNPIFVTSINGTQNVITLKGKKSSNLV